MQSIRQVQRLNQRELDNAIPSSASWHTDYRDTAYVYVGGIPLDLSEGDVIAIFSQYGDPAWIKLARDKDTGKSRGFAWLRYEDQRSCDLAVDNLSGATVMGRLLAVDHARYKRRDDENEADGYVGQDRLRSRGGRDEEPLASESEDEAPTRPLIKEEIELAKLLKEQDAEDPMTAYLIEQKRGEVDEALKALAKSSREDRPRDKDRRHHHRHRDGERRRRRHRSTSRAARHSSRRDGSRSASPRRHRQ